MPPAKKPTHPSTRTRAAFKEPAAFNRLNRSLDAAQDALAELRMDTGRDVGRGARDLYKDLRAFILSARRDSGKLAKALQRDFEQAQKRLAGAPAVRSRAGATASRPRRSQAAPRSSKRKAS